jgi:hypothetical protein
LSIFDGGVVGVVAEQDVLSKDVSYGMCLPDVSVVPNFRSEADRNRIQKTPVVVVEDVSAVSSMGRQNNE